MPIGARIEDLKVRGAHEWTVGKYTVYSLTVDDSCGECGNHSIEFVAVAGGEFVQAMICSDCDSVVTYLYPNEDDMPLIII